MSSINKSKKSKPSQIMSDFSYDLAHAGDSMFEGTLQHDGEEHKDKITRAVSDWVNKPSDNVAMGLARGLVSFGSQTIKGVTGIITEPIKGAKEDGGLGFVVGVAKGLTGVVTRPIAGLVDLGAKTTEGFVNTPITIAEGIKEATMAPDNLPLVPENSPMHFGKPLGESFQLALENRQIHITLEVQQHLEYFGFRDHKVRLMSGRQSLIKVGILFLTGEEVKFDELINAHDVAGILKLYLRELPEGLIPEYCWISLFNVTDNDSVFLEKILKLMGELPPVSRFILYKLMTLLDSINRASDINKMTTQNLAVCLSPNIFRENFQTPNPNSLQTQSTVEILGGAMENYQKSNKAFQVMLVNWEDIVCQM